jgi:hypothetical protein
MMWPVHCSLIATSTPRQTSPGEELGETFSAKAYANTKIISF